MKYFNINVNEWLEYFFKGKWLLSSLCERFVVDLGNPFIKITFKHFCLNLGCFNKLHCDLY